MVWLPLAAVWLPLAAVWLPLTSVWLPLTSRLSVPPLDTRRFDLPLGARPAAPVALLPLGARATALAFGAGTTAPSRRSGGRRDMATARRRAALDLGLAVPVQGQAAAVTRDALADDVVVAIGAPRGLWSTR